MARPRVFISTDLRLSSEEKDDAQSLIHALLYQDRMNIVGISGTASKHGHQDGLVRDIDRIIDVYAEDQAKLEAHSSAFKSVAELKAVSWQGATNIAPSAGYSSATDSSRAIIAEAKKAAAAGEKLNVLTWGGETDLAQALHDAPSIASHVRFFNISRQDYEAYDYIKSNFKGKLDLWVDDQSTFRGMYQTPTSTGIIKGWHEVNADGHGALGSYFSDLSGDIFNVSGVKMGDSPTVLRFLSGDQDDPTRESWGGEFVKASERYYVDNQSSSLDLGGRPNTKGAMTVYEDRAEWLDSFADRFDWLKDGSPAPKPSTPPEPAPQPPSPPSGTDADTVKVRISGDAWEGDPSFALLVNGRTVDGSSTVTADRADGEWQTFTFRGDFDLDGSDRVSLRFTNDHYEGSGRDRNLHVDEVALNGVVNGTNQTLYSNGTKSWGFEDGRPAGAPGGSAPDAPSGGADTVRVRVSGDAWEGDPSFALLVNGRTVDATSTVTADRADGEWQTFTFTGDFDLDGTDRVGLRFTNDHYEGSGRDRNLHVDEVTLNGEINGANRSLYSNGTATWEF